MVKPEQKPRPKQKVIPLARASQRNGTKTPTFAPPKMPPIKSGKSKK